MSLRLYLRDRDNRRQGEIDDFQGFSHTRKWTGVGSFTLNMPAHAPILRFSDSRAGILAVNNNEVEFSGPFTGVEVVREKEQGGLHESLEVVGTDDNVLLRDRYAAPDLPPYNRNAYYARSGPAEGVIKGFVAYNLASGSLANEFAWDALPSRRASVELATYYGRGKEIIGTARFEQLDELVSELCLVAGDWGWSVRQGVEGYAKEQLVFDIHQSRTLVDSVTFSLERGTLATYTYRLDRPEANYLVVAGQGELTDRDFVEGGDNASIEKWGLIEGPLRDRRDTDLPNELRQTLAEELVTQSEKHSISFKVLETDSQQYGKHWQLGDVVTVKINDLEFYQTVREVTVDYTPGAPREVSALISTPDTVAPDVPALFAAQRNALYRAHALERRK